MLARPRVRRRARDRQRRRLSRVYTRPEVRRIPAGPARACRHPPSVTCHQHARGCRAPAVTSRTAPGDAPYFRPPVLASTLRADRPSPRATYGPDVNRRLGPRCPMPGTKRGSDALRGDVDGSRREPAPGTGPREFGQEQLDRPGVLATSEADPPPGGDARRVRAPDVATGPPGRPGSARSCISRWHGRPTRRGHRVARDGADSDWSCTRGARSAGRSHRCEGWCDERGVDVRAGPGHGAGAWRRGDPADCDLIVALGGDGTTLAALRPGAVRAAGARRGVRQPRRAHRGAPTAPTAARWTASRPATGRRARPGDWRSRARPDRAGVNDLVVVRQGAGQVSARGRVDGELFIRFAGDGLVTGHAARLERVHARRGRAGARARRQRVVVTPLAPHGGCCPPLVAGRSRLAIELEPGSRRRADRARRPDPGPRWRRARARAHHQPPRPTTRRS